jgi:hypothetical protein
MLARFRIATGLTVLTLTLTPLTVGCHSSRIPFVSKPGRYVGDASLGRIVPGETDAEWILAVLGRPKDVESLAGGVEEIWKYQYSRIGASTTDSYLINSRPERGQTARYIYIQLSGGIVNDWWKD